MKLYEVELVLGFKSYRFVEASFIVQDERIFVVLFDACNWKLNKNSVKTSMRILGVYLVDEISCKTSLKHRFFIVFVRKNAERLQKNASLKFVIKMLLFCESKTRILKIKLCCNLHNTLQSLVQFWSFLKNSFFDQINEFTIKNFQKFFDCTSPKFFGENS